MDLNSKDFQKDYPFVCLNMLLKDERVKVEGLRPHQEFKQILKETSLIMKRTNPHNEWQNENEAEMIGSGGFGQVYKVT